MLLHIWKHLAGLEQLPSKSRINIGLINELSPVLIARHCGLIDSLRSRYNFVRPVTSKCRFQELLVDIPFLLGFFRILAFVRVFGRLSIEVVSRLVERGNGGAALRFRDRVSELPARSGHCVPYPPCSDCAVPALGATLGL